MTTKEYFKGKNFMTPTVLRYIRAGKYATELSAGTGFGGFQIYGVTVINTINPKLRTGLSKVFDSYNDALKYIESLGK